MNILSRKIFRSKKIPVTGRWIKYIIRKLQVCMFHQIILF